MKINIMLPTIFNEWVIEKWNLTQKVKIKTCYVILQYLTMYTMYMFTINTVLKVEFLIHNN